jgi:hypothetical protein
MIINVGTTQMPNIAETSAHPGSIQLRGVAGLRNLAVIMCSLVSTI